MLYINNYSSVDDTLKYIGARIKETRINKMMSQDDLALKTGVSTSSIYRLEQGKSIQMDSFIRILRALNMLGMISAVMPEQRLTPTQIMDMQRSRPGNRRTMRSVSDNGTTMNRRYRVVKRKIPTDASKIWEWGE